MTTLTHYCTGLRQNNKKAFVAYVTCGYPDVETTRAVVETLARCGVDIIELGMPFSDPIADGPIIQEASYDALQHGLRTRDIFTLTRALRAHTNIPLVLMGYYNPIFHYGETKFIARAAQSGISGFVIPDLPLEESTTFDACAADHACSHVYLVSPVTTPDRLKLIASRAAGFIYYVSLTGVTGTRNALATDIGAQVKAIKRVTALPVYVGFGISSPEQAATVSACADGIIIGSALVSIIRSAGSQKKALKDIAAFATAVRSAVC